MTSITQKFNRVVMGLFLALTIIFAIPSEAQYTNTLQSDPQNTACPSTPGLGIDLSTGITYGCGNNHLYNDGHTLFPPFQGATATSITTGNFTVLTGPGATVKIPAGTINQAGKTVVLLFSGLDTTAAASLLNAEISLCTVQGCGSGTVVSPVGCVITSTNQANVLANGQFNGECRFTVASTGAAATLMATSTCGFQLGAATSAALSVFAHLATGVSTAVDLTVDEFISVQFKFTTSNAGNAATLLSLSGYTIG